MKGVFKRTKMEKKVKPLVIEPKKPQKVVLFNHRGEALIIERNRSIGFQLREN